jgi:hypothetical protein
MNERDMQATLEKHRKWLYAPPGYEATQAQLAAHELASALAAALTRNEKIARARNRNAGFATQYRDKALAFQQTILRLRARLTIFEANWLNGGAVIDPQDCVGSGFKLVWQIVYPLPLAEAAEVETAWLRPEHEGH